MRPSLSFLLHPYPSSSSSPLIRTPALFSLPSRLAVRTPINHTYPSHRAFSILSQHQKGLEHLKRLPQQKPKKAESSSNPNPTVSSSSPSSNATETSTSISPSPLSSSSSSSPAPTDENNAIVPRPPEPSSLDMTQQVIRDLEHQGALHDATMELMEKSPEWRDYDAHVNYELNMVRTRYAATKEPLTGARRAQLSAHLRATQQEVMEAHADAAVEQLLSNLSTEEMDQLRVKLRSIDASVPISNEEYYTQQNGEGKNGGGSIFDKEFQNALQDLSTFLASVKNVPNSPLKKK